MIAIPHWENLFDTCRQSLENPKFQAPKYKWFDRLTTLSNVEG